MQKSPMPRAWRLPTWMRSAAYLVFGACLGVGGTFGLQQWQNAGEESPVVQTPNKQNRQPRTLVMDLLLQGDPVLGKPSAPITIVEFSDYQCPYCRRFQQQVFPKLKREFIDEGLVRLIHKDLPLPFHQQAETSAAVARCAEQQDAFWPVHQALYDQQSCLECRGPIAIAVAAGLNGDELDRCLRQPAILEAVRSNRSESTLHDISATPTFVIGPTIGRDRHRGQIVEGALPWPQFKSLIEQQLKKASLDAKR
ncbi:putative oxidoreductase [Synechococcus sp. PROS-7-1]|nr:putative oxidoreductase [Synechococcus sp. PROS-7-1]